MSKGPLELVPIPPPILWNGVNMSWSRKDKYKSPEWAGDLWSASPMDHQQLATRMVCLWGLVKAYQWTWQSVYVCLLAPHVLEAYNHKVNHDTHKELNIQEHAVLQYARALQYVSFCNNARYIRTIGHQQSKTSGQRLLSLSEAGLSGI